MQNINHYLFPTVFLTGAGVLILEVAAVRLLAPYYGSSLYVFSSVLTVILAALSFGYWYGGRRADRNHSIKELYWIIIGSGLSVLLLLVIGAWVLPASALQLGVQIGPMIFSLVLFFLPAFLLGIVSPYIIKLQSLTTPVDHIGSVVGKTFFFGTLGSILGSILAGYWLIPTYGVQDTILWVGLGLLAVGILMPYGLKERLDGMLVLIVLFVTGSLWLVLTQQTAEARAEFIYYDEGLYSSIKIRDRVENNRIVRYLHRDRNNSSAIYLTSTELPFMYAQFAEAYPTLVPDAEHFLLLGGGAYTIPRTLHATNPELKIDVVEIEPSLFDLAKKYFDLPDTNKITNYPIDARVFLQQSEKQYDVIFIDTFGTDLAPPFHLTTLEFYELVAERLAPGGIMMINVIGTPKTVRPALFGSVLKTVTEVFPNTAIYPVTSSDVTQQQNIVLISRQGEAPITFTDEVIDYRRAIGKQNIVDLEIPLADFDLEEEMILTDDRAPVGWLMSR